MAKASIEQPVQKSVQKPVQQTPTKEENKMFIFCKGQTPINLLNVDPFTQTGKTISFVMSNGSIKIWGFQVDEKALRAYGLILSNHGTPINV